MRPRDLDAGLHPSEFRVLVTGSRTWDDYRTMADAICDAIASTTKEPVIVHGACELGADYLAEVIAKAFHLRSEPHPAFWSTYGRRAGAIRNRQMVKLGADVCLAFIRDGSPGASMCARFAEQAGIPTRRYVRSSDATA